MQLTKMFELIFQIMKWQTHNYFFLSLAFGTEDIKENSHQREQTYLGTSTATYVRMNGNHNMISLIF